MVISWMEQIEEVAEGPPDLANLARSCRTLLQGGICVAGPRDSVRSRRVPRPGRPCASRPTDHPPLQEGTGEGTPPPVITLPNLVGALLGVLQWALERVWDDNLR